MSAFKKLNRQDVFVTSYTSKKEWSTSDGTPSDFGIQKFKILSGSFPYYSGSENYSEYLQYEQLQHLYYSNFSASNISGSFENYIQSSLETGSRVLSETGSVISFPRNITGQRLEPRSNYLYFLTQSNYVSIVDNSEGKLIISESGGDSFNPFDTGGGTNAQVTSTAIDSNGKIYLGGLFTNYSGSTYNRIVKVNADGTVDSTFSIGTGFGASDNVRVIKPLSDGKVLVGGSLTTYNGTGVTHLIRVNSDGSRDTTFDPGTISSAVNDVVVQADNKVIVAGEFDTFSGSSSRGLIRIDANGTVDSSFNTGGGLASSVVYSIALQADEKVIVAAGNATYSGSTTQKIIRVNTNGTIDGTFTAPSIGAGTPDYVTLDSSEKVLVGGGFSTPTNDIMRLLTDGSQDTTFDVGVGTNGAVDHIALQSDGKILFGGTFTTYSGSSIARLARVNTDGILDTDFSSSLGTGFTNNAIETISIQSDDYIVVGGSFTGFSGSTVNRIIRLGPDGESQGISSNFPTLFPTGSIVGDIIYTHGIAVITDNTLAEVINGTNDYTASWQSNYPILTQNVICKVSDFEFNFTQNPSAVISGSDGKLTDNATGSDFRPYITAIGLYNDANELIAVGKFGQPIPKPSYVDTTFILKLDL